MALLYFIRHAETDDLGRILSGRLPGVHLNHEGQRHAEALAQRLRGIGATALYCSPIQRAVETAEPIERELQLRMHVLEDLTEVDFGEWTGRRFPELDEDTRWRHYNTCRSLAAVPGGEHFLSVQLRMVRCAERLRRMHEKAPVLIVSHGDPIKTAVVYYAGLPLDAYTKVDIAPASLTAVHVEDAGARIMMLNHV